MPSGRVTSWAVVAFPAWGKSDSAWIEAVRRRGDPNAGRIAAHVTLRFPAPLAGIETFRERLHDIAARTAPFHARFDRVGRMDDPFNPEQRHLSLLLPDASGAAHFSGLHASIADFPAAYTPHITIGRFAASADIAEFERSVGSPPTQLRGRIEAFELLRVSGANIVADARFPFLAAGD